MNKSDKDINRLTRKILKEGMVEPSPDLSLKIMDLIMQEEPLKVPEVKKVKWHSGMSPFMIIGIIIVYLVAFAGLLMLVGQQPEGNVNHLLTGLKEKLPFILTMVAIAGSLIFYGVLDFVLGLGFCWIVGWLAGAAPHPPLQAIITPLHLYCYNYSHRNKCVLCFRH